MSMRNRSRVLGAALVTLILTAGIIHASGADARELAVKGLETFHLVLGGDSAKYREAIRNLEESDRLDGANIPNLYNLARAYFYEANTQGNREALSKAERTVSRILELEPENPEALAWHGSMLTALSRGQDMGQFMRGIGEMKRADEIDPSNTNNKIVKAFTAMNFPPPALAAMGNYDPISDLEFVRDAFDGEAFYYAPQAQVVITALVGDAYLLKRNDRQAAREQFARALAYAQPRDENALAGRKVLDDAIRTRMNGGEQPLFGSIMTTCYSCHLTEPDKIKH